MKILILHQTSNQDTLINFFKELATNTAITELIVLSPSGGYDSFRKKYRENRSYNSDKFKLILGEVFFKERKIVNPYKRGLLKLIKEFNPDIVHVMYEAISSLILQVSLYRYLFKFKYKILFYGFENIYPKKLSSFPLLKRLTIKFIINNIDGGAYANSEGIMVLEKLGFKTNNIRRIFRPLEINKIKGIEKKSIFTVGYIGRISKDKGVFSFFDQLSRLNPNIKVCLIGSIEEESLSLFEKTVKANSCLDYIPEVSYEKLFETISQFHVIIVPSRTTKTWKEQFGKVIPEAMWTNNIVIGSNSGAIPEVIGNTELIFKEDHPEDLVNILNKISNNVHYYNKLLEYIKKRRIAFSNKVISEEFVGLYIDTLKI